MSKPTVSAALPSPDGKSLAMRSLEGETAQTGRKPLADGSVRVALGADIDAALSEAGISKQEAAYRLGYGQNQSPISRWTAGTENQPLARLWQLGPAFQRALVIRLARRCGDRVNVETRITLDEAAS